MKDYLNELKDQYYGDEAKNYEKNRRKRKVWKEENDFVENCVKKIKPDTILDIPVGTGRFLSFYEEQGIGVVGVDVSDAMLMQAKQKDTRAILKKGDAFNLQFQDEVFECIVCIRFLHRIKPKDLHRLFEEFARVVRCCIILNIRFYYDKKYETHVNPKNGYETYRHSETDFHHIRNDFGFRIQEQKRRKSKEYETGYFLLRKAG